MERIVVTQQVQGRGEIGGGKQRVMAGFIHLRVTKV